MNKYTVQLGLALCLVLLVITTQVNGEEERVVRLRNMAKIMEDEKDFQSSVQLTEPDAEGHTQLSGELKHTVTLDNDWKVNVTAYRKEKPEDEYIVYKDFPLMGVCQVMGSCYKTMFYEKLKNYSNAPHPDQCPLAPGHYHLKDYPLDSSQLKKMLTPGYYLADWQLMKDGELKLHYKAEIQVV